MSDNNKPVFAYPSAVSDTITHFTPGMTLRDWFAGQALAGRLASGPSTTHEQIVAEVAYQYADAMLKARNS